MMRRTDEPVRVKTGPRRVSDGKKPSEKKQTCLLRSYEDGQHRSNLRDQKLVTSTTIAWTMSHLVLVFLSRDSRSKVLG